MIEKWVLHEATEVYNYWSCMQSETNPRIKQIWERFLDYELGHLQQAMSIFQQVERRDAAEILPKELPEPIGYHSHREFVRETLRREVNLRARGTEFIPSSEEGADSPSVVYRTQMNSEGSPSERVAAGWLWTPGTELSRRIPTGSTIQERKAS